MTALDKLRELDAAASPGPWTWKTGESIDAEQGDKGHDSVVLDAKGNSSGGPLIILSGVWEDDERDRVNVSLASLAHLLLPAFEALERCVTKIEHTASSHASAQWAEAATARSVLAKLEEALQ